MTAIAQSNPNPELDALLARVKAQVASCKLTEAILVDDKLDTDPTDVQWIQAVAKLRTDDKDRYAALAALYKEAGQEKVDELPNDDIWDKAIGLVNASTAPSVTAIISRVEYKEKALEHLVALLKEVGLTAVCRTRVTKDDPPRTGKLYFLDYRMQGDQETAGLDAAILLRDLVEQKHETPPAAVLMSRGEDKRPSKDDWEQVAQNAGYYRFNFRYLDKGDLEAGKKMAFLVFLHELLEAYPLGKEYYAQLAKVRDAAQSAANAALARIRQLSPSEFTIFAGKHLGDNSGRRASRHMLELFLGLLDAEVKDDEKLETSFREFAHMLRTMPMLASKDKDTHALHQLHCRLLYDRSKWAIAGPIVFGDMYRKLGESDVFYLVLTPECDLELRYIKETDRWLPKVDDILMLRGEVASAMPEKKDYLIIHPFVSEKGQKWISWSLRQRVIAKVTDLVYHKTQDPSGWQTADGNGFTCYGYGADPNRYHKWGRLRNTEAEHIQQQFASDLAAVGIDDISGNTHAMDVELWDNRNVQAPLKIADLVIVETANLKEPKKPYLALGEGCELTLCAENASEMIVPFANLVEMRKPSIRNDFLALCQKSQLYLVATDGEPLRLVRSKQAVKDGWKPPKPKVMAEPAADQEAETEAKPTDTAAASTKTDKSAPDEPNIAPGRSSSKGNS